MIVLLTDKGVNIFLAPFCVFFTALYSRKDDGYV